MLRSMTGFGKGLAENNLGSIKVEIKSLNYKFFEVTSKLPPNLTIFEDNIREYLQKRTSRGRLNLFISYEKNPAKINGVFVNKQLAKKYYKMLLDLKKSLRMAGEIRLEQLLSLPEVVVQRQEAEDGQKTWPLVEKALSLAVRDLIRSREREGAMLKKQLRNIVSSIETSLAKIKSRAPAVAGEYKQRLVKNIKVVTGSKKILNQERIEEEIAVFARSCDIAEETHRVCSHIAGFKKALVTSGEIGRRLDFIAQEIHREINTIGAKANDFPISKEVIKIKSLVEKIREQVQNVE